MRAYLAVILDSLYAAIATRTLVVTTVLIFCTVLAFSCIGLKQTLTARFLGDEIQDAVGIRSRLVQIDKETADSPVRRVWLQMDENVRKQMIETVEGKQEDDPTRGPRGIREINEVQEHRARITQALNKCIDDPKFYDKELFKSVNLNEEAKLILETSKDQPTGIEAARLNRLLLEEIFAGQVAVSSPTSVGFTVLFWDFTKETQVPRALFVQGFHQLVPWVLDKFFLSIGIIVSVLISANVFPSLLDPATLNLTFSKPVSRWAIVISKFIGECAFTAVNSCFLLVGLYLVFGVRWGLWEPVLLLCIPIYVFVFAIYFSFTMLVGLVTRNAIISVIATGLFWLFCFVIGVSYSTVGGFRTIGEPDRVLVAGDEVFFSSKLNRQFQFNKEKNDWDVVFSGDLPPNVPPMMASMLPNNVIIFDIFKTGADELMGVSTAEGDISRRSTSREVFLATRATGFKKQRSIPLPPNTIGVYEEDENNFVVATQLGKLYRLEKAKVRENAVKLVEENSENPDAPKPTPAQAAEEERKRRDLWKTTLVEITPSEPLALRDIEKLTFNAENKNLVSYGNKKVVVWKAEGGKYSRPAELRFDHSFEKRVTNLAAGGETALLMLSDGTAVAIDLVSGKEKGRLKVADAERTQVRVSRDGKRAAVWGMGSTFSYLNLENGVANASLGGLGWEKVCAIGSTDSGNLLVAYSWREVREFEFGTGKVVKSTAPTMSSLDTIYYWAIRPIYYICPKPGNFYPLVSYLMKKVDTSKDSDDSSDDLLNEQPDDTSSQTSVFEPVWNGLIFVTLIVGLSVLYVVRRDF